MRFYDPVRSLFERSQSRSRRHRVAIVLSLAIALGGCFAEGRATYNGTLQKDARVPGYEGIRVWGDGNLADFAQAGMSPPKSSGGTLNFLALSGGGSGGAFGAGVLAGWTASGKRPRFDLVSGVSTGALIAPFAFLGSHYDERLKFLYTGGATEGLIKVRWLPAGLLGSGLLEGEPLRKMVEQYADNELLKEIAIEHRRGRRLIVVTTNMDAQRPVVWDMGKIATSSNPNALKLFQNILIASSSIPAAFPPVFIDVVSNGSIYSEMHADGATTAQIFTVPDGVFREIIPLKAYPKIKSTIYIIVNNTLAPEFDLTNNNTLSIGSRGLSTVIKAQTRSSINATYSFAQQAGLNFNLATINKNIKYDPSNAFGLRYTNSIYEFGYSEATKGSIWRKKPDYELVAD